MIKKNGQANVQSGYEPFWGQETTTLLRRCVRVILSAGSHRISQRIKNAQPGIESNSPIFQCEKNPGSWPDSDGPQPTGTGFLYLLSLLVF